MRANAAATLIALSFALAGCGDARPGAKREPAAEDPGTVGGAADTSTAGPVTAPIRNPAGRELGTLTLSPDGQGIAIEGRLTGVPPGEHGFHLHTVGRCDPPTFESAGDHWNPTNRQHGSESPKGPHLGDLANLKVAQDSSVAVEATTPGGTLQGENALLDTDGAAVVVHAKPDDGKSQPSGDSGDRIACGAVSGS